MLLMGSTHLITSTPNCTTRQGLHCLRFAAAGGRYTCSCCLGREQSTNAFTKALCCQGSVPVTGTATATVTLAKEVRNTHRHVDGFVHALLQALRHHPNCLH